MTEEKQNLIEELSDVDPENYFRVANGTIVKNLKELDMAIENMSDETFKCHVSEVRNDFSIWIREVIKDENLANELLQTKDRCRTQLLILRRIVEILTKYQKFSKV
jgi:hypothetical protein